MQTALVFIFWALFSVVFQTAVLCGVSRPCIQIDLLFYLIVILGLRYRPALGIILAAFLGFVMDVVSAVPAGVTICSYVLSLLFIHRVQSNVFIESRVSLFAWVMGFSVFRQIIQAALLAACSRRLSALPVMLLQSLFDALLGLIVIPFLNRLLVTDWGRVFRRKGIRG
jgi:rod shape-determining protein MreD